MSPETQSPRERLSRLLIGCPHQLIAHPNPIECPLHEQRARPLAARLAWARTVDASVVERVLGYHDLCLAKRRILELEGYEQLVNCDLANSATR